MSLVISSTPSNNITTNTPIFLDWAPANNQKEFFWAPAVFSLILPQTVEFNVKDVIGNPEFSQYSEFRLLASKAYFGTTPFYWLVPDTFKAANGTTVSPINSGPLPITNNDTKLFYLISLQNLSLMPIASTPYQYKIYFFLEGKNASNTWVQCGSYVYTIKLYVTNDLVTCAPSSLVFTHYQGTSLPSQTININGPSWSLVAKPNFDLSSSNPSVTITEETVGSSTFKKATGTGDADIEVTLGEFYDTGVIDPSELYKEFSLLQGATLVKNIPVSITVFDEASLNLSPDNISFYGVKEIQEPVAVNMFYSSSNPTYSIITSPWLTYSEEIIEFLPGIFGPMLVVVPIPTSNMSVGVYTGFVKIQAVISGTLREKTAIVTYDLQGFITSPYLPNTKAFTLDVKYFNLFSNNLNTYFQLTAIIKVFEFFTNAQTTEIINEKIPLFKGKAEINYGDIIHKIMKRFATPNTNYFQYKLAELELKAEEINAEDKSVIRSATLPNVSFVAGLSRGETTLAILDFNPKASRVTKNSFYYLNLLIPGFGYEVRIFKNGTLLSRNPLAYNLDTIVSLKMPFSSYNQGDFIEFSLNKAIAPLNLKNRVKAFNVIPTQNYSNHIVWENEYLLQSILEVTGDITIKPEFENNTYSVYKNLVEILEIISSNKVNKITVNTGWLTRNDIDTIESICRSKKAWITLGGKTIDLRPITKSLTTEDSKRELVEFTLEFQINRKYNEETYSL